MAQVDLFVKSIIVKVIIFLVIILAAYFLIIRPVLIKLNVIDSAEDRKRDKESKQLGTSTDSPFHPDYYKNKPGALLVTKATAEKIGDQINDAIGIIYDDENAVYGALRQLSAKTQLSFVADIFFQRHKMDLYQLLQRNLGEKELEVVHGIAANLV
jgi:hypothetical protein